MRSVLNTVVVDTTKQPMFLGEGLSLQRYDKCKYEIFLTLFKKQLGFFWRPEEISLVKDRGDYKQLTEHEKFIFTSNLKFQTMMDSVIARAIPNLTQYVSLPELEACMNIWAAFETIHSYSYSYLINNVYPDPSEVLDSVLMDSEIVKRANSVSWAFDALAFDASERPIKERIYLGLMSTNILEAVRFYVSFACALAFEQNNKMCGNAQIIKLIRNDEACMSDDTEILTPNGWVKFPELKNEDLVAQYTLDGKIEFVLPNKVIRKSHNGDMIRFKNAVGHIDMLLTPDHRVIYENLDGNFVETTADSFKPNHLKKIVVSGEACGKREEISTYERFLIALQADGTIRDTDVRDGSRSGYHCVSFCLKRDRKIVRLESILSDLGFSYSKSNPDNRGRTTFYVSVPVEHLLTKNFSEWIKLETISSNWCKGFIEELMNWDGSLIESRPEYLYYSSSVESNSIMAQTIGCLAGYKTYIFQQEDSRKSSYKTMHRVSFQTDKRTQSGQSLKKETVDYNGIVYCVSVPSGMFLAKRNGGIFVTGNCHMSITQTILKYMRDNDEEGFTDVATSCKNEATQMFLEAAEEEKAWATYLFNNGGMIGLNEKIMHQYIESLVDKRLIGAGLDKYFGTKNPISWLEADSRGKQTAPQEQEIISYKVGAFKNDLSNAKLEW
jgi:ribonucleotide reductase beta subunit family protein with ferritin-like domain